MSEDGKAEVTVNAADIARLADVGRAAVSNWRKRFDDFPRPVGGNASSPAFALADVEQWLRRHDRYIEVPPLERAWQRLRAIGDDLLLGEVVGYTGAFLLYLQRDRPGWRKLSRLGDAELLRRLPRAVAETVPELPGRLPDWLDRVDPALIHAFAELGAEHGPAAAFEEICARYLGTHSRRLLSTPQPVAELMAKLAGTDGGTVLDPACGIGTLLLSSGAARALGQDVNESAARVTTVRLLLHGTPAVVRSGDSLRADAFPGERVDAVVCNPPFNDRGWGYEELASDPRWEYGLPPRGEPELAWVQHCLSHLRPGGLAVVMMPGPAADRRAGRRIRGTLLRAGALRAVVTLSVGAAPASSGAPDLWVLRRPEPGDRPPSDVLMVDAGEDLTAAQIAWRTYRAGRRPPDSARAIRIIDLLDEEVALVPPRHVSGPGRPDPAAFSAVREEAVSALAGLDLPVLAALVRPRDLGRTSIGELAKAGAVTVLQAPLRMRAEGGELPVLTVKDLLLDRAPSGRTDDEQGLVVIAPGDVIAPLIPREDSVARVMTLTGAVLGPQLLLLRPDPERLDPFFLAGCLRGAGEAGVRPGSSGRLDPRRAQLPRLPIEEQRVYGETFRRLLAFEDAVRAARKASETLVRLGFDGLLEGTLEPG